MENIWLTKFCIERFKSMEIGQLCKLKPNTTKSDQNGYPQTSKYQKNEAQTRAGKENLLAEEAEQQIPVHSKRNARHSLNLDDCQEIEASALIPDRFLACAIAPE